MAEPQQRRTRDDGSKFYEHPHRTEEIREGGGGMITVRPARYVSVTTALGVCAKPALIFWSGNVAAERAMANLPKLIAAARIDGCGRARGRTEPLPCGECAECVEYWVALAHHAEKERRAREGSCAHDILEWWIRTGEWVYKPREDHGEWAPTHEQMAPYMASLKAFIADYALTREAFLAAECTVWNHTLKYAGTLDFIVTIKPVTKPAADLCARVNQANGQPADATVRVLGDCKSREGEGVELYQEQPLQLGAYRYAETMTPKYGAAEMEMAMFATDAAAILQVRPDGYTFRPVVTDGNTMKAFRAVLDLYAWTDEHGDASTLVKAFPRPDGWKPPTWERATDPTGTLCGCPYCDDPTDSRCMFSGVRPPGRHTKKPPPPKLLPTDEAPIVKSQREEADAPPVKATPRKRATKRAAPAVAGQDGASSATLAMIRNQSITDHIPDDQIPF